MGCDIHLFTERKRHINNEEKWVNVDNWKLNPYYTEGSNDERKYELNPAYENRDYELFYILAGVRNYGNNIPIAKPRGLPDDVSGVVLKESNEWGVDGHSSSYFTMRELYDYVEKNPESKYQGLVDADGVKSIKEGKMPAWWCQGSTRNDMVNMEWSGPSVLKLFISDLENHFKSEFYNKNEESDKFRIVFWFDN